MSILRFIALVCLVAITAVQSDVNFHGLDLLQLERGLSLAPVFGLASEAQLRIMDQVMALFFEVTRSDLRSVFEVEMTNEYDTTAVDSMIAKGGFYAETRRCVTALGITSDDISANDLGKCDHWGNEKVSSEGCHLVCHILHAIGSGINEFNDKEC